MTSPANYNQLVLYGTSSCHLCEEAEAVLHQAGISFLKLDIVEDDVLFEKYSLRIPVLKRLDNGDEIDWRFDTASVLRFLK
jgi:hypothetical protein